MTQTRVLLVTGASSGIGRAVSEQAAARRDALTLVGRDEAALKEVAERCRMRGSDDVHVHAADFGDPAQVVEVVAGVVERHGRLDAVVR